MECARVSFLLLVYFLVNCSAAVSTRRLQWVVDDAGCRTPNKGIGNCLRISECNPMIDFLSSKNNFTKKEKEILASYQCGAYGNEAKVCCPNEPINLGWAIDDEGCRTPDSGVGICIRITDCKIIYNYIEQTNDISDRITSEIKEYACGYDGDMVKVCCPSKLPLHWTQTISRMGDDSQHRNIKLLPPRSECGKSNTLNRIINGNVTELFEYPWATVLKYQRDINPYSCGASLISKRYVLTAAHCVRSKYKLISVRLGEYNFTTEVDCIWDAEEKVCSPPHEDFDISVDDAVVHEGYDANTLVNDIALIRLPRDAAINSENIYPICLPVSEVEKSLPISQYTVIGWGATETGFASKVLLKVSVPYVDTPKCAPLYAVRTQVTDNQLCAGGKKEQDSCAGDSGGPLSADYTAPGSGTVSIQYGIVSFGPRICGRESFPAVYTRVSKYISWILDNMRE